MTPRKLSAVGAAAALLVFGAGLAGCNATGAGSIFHRGAGPVAATTAQRREAPDPNRPTGTIDPRDVTATPAPPRTAPIAGQSPNPMGVPPQGALPNPYNNPPR